MKEKILLFGAQGLLGYDLFNVLSEDFEVIPYASFNLNLLNTEKIAPEIEKIKPDIVINCAAFTDTEKAEDEHWQEQVLALNVFAPAEMAKACEKIGARFIHFSTDFVFDGKNPPYTEDSKKNPLSFYGKSKAQSEDIVQKNCSKAVIIRTAWLFGKNGPSFVLKILAFTRDREEISAVQDIFVSMTYTLDLANAVKQLLLNKKFEQKIYHFVNEGSHSLYEIAEMAIKIKGLKTIVKPVSADTFPSKVERPKKALLKNSSDIKLRPFKEALEDFLK